MQAIPIDFTFIRMLTNKNKSVTKYSRDRNPKSI